MRSLRNSCVAIQLDGTKLGCHGMGTTHHLMMKLRSLCRLSTLVKKLKNQGIIERYDNVIKEQIEEGIVERTIGPANGREFCKPHKAVVRGL